MQDTILKNLIGIGLLNGYHVRAVISDDDGFGTEREHTVNALLSGCVVRCDWIRGVDRKRGICEIDRLYFGQQLVWERV